LPAAAQWLVNLNALTRGDARSWESVRPPKRERARRTRGQGSDETLFGYKMHLAVDQDSGLVRQAILTPANVSDKTPFPDLVQGDEQAVYADKGYDGWWYRQGLAEVGSPTASWPETTGAMAGDCRRQAARFRRPAGVAGTDSHGRMGDIILDVPTADDMMSLTRR